MPLPDVEKQLVHVRPARDEAGSSTLLVVSVALPFLFFLAAVTLEINSYFGVHEEIQKIADAEAMRALRSRRSNTVTEGVVRESVEKLKPLVSITRVSSVRTDRDASVAVSASFELSISRLLSLIGTPGTSIPIRVESRYRRATSSAAILFDRYVSPATDPCQDSDLTSTEAFVAQLAAAYSQIGATRIAVGVIPGSTRVIEPVSLDGINDLLSRCGSGPIPTGTAAVTSLAGVSANRPDPWTLGRAFEDFLGDIWQGAPTERWDLVLVTRETAASWQDLPIALDRVNSFAVSSAILIDLRHVAVGSGSERSSDYASSVTSAAGLNAKLVNVKDVSMLNQELATAIVSSNNLMLVAR